MRDSERRDRLGQAIRSAGVDALIAALPSNVLLLTGYFPVVGTAVAVAGPDHITLIAPRDERELAEAADADQVIHYEPASLDRMSTAAGSIREPLQKVLNDRKLGRAVLGWESGEALEPASYASMHLFGETIAEVCCGATMKPASELFHRMKARLTSIELDCVRRACRVAAAAFEQGRQQLRPGLTETAAAAAFRAPLAITGVGFEGAARADGYVSCMAGENSSRAYGAYARSRPSAIKPDDFVLTHCNSHVDGYWTDITRTYMIGEPDDRRRRMYEAVFEARRAALAEVRPGARTSDVDRAARDVMRSHGFGAQFKHSTGHGVGFAAIDHNALPRLHPLSEDRLDIGMVFNIEPALYIDGFGGLRHCDMVAVTEKGVELLTPFQCALDMLILSP